jgi:cytochrome b pre-mRNA-processing protein 3
MARQEGRVLGFLRRRRQERLGFDLYGSAVAAARAPVFYRDLAVPDTLDGRFDLVGLHVFLLIRRLGALPPPGPATAQAVFDAMFSDMDFNLREMGVSDLVVGRRVKAMWEALHGRSAAYAAALELPPQARGDALAAALARNVWRGRPPKSGPEGDAVRRLAHQVLRCAETLDALPAEALLAGRLRFPVPAEVAA